MPREKANTAPSSFVAGLESQVKQPTDTPTFDPFAKAAGIPSAAPASELETIDISDAEQPSLEELLPENSESVESAQADSTPPPPSPSVDPVAVLAETLNRMAEQATIAQQPPAPSNGDIERLLNLLNPALVGMLYEQAATRHVSLIEVLAGMIQRVGEQGEVGDLLINPEWSSQLASRYPTSGSFAIGGTVTTAAQRRQLPPSICEHCNHQFQPTMPTQRFCCNECGKRFAGYAEDGNPHSSGCTTSVGKALDAALAKAAAARAVAAKPAVRQQSAHL